jgi:hypothetical protein
MLQHHGKVSPDLRRVKLRAPMVAAAAREVVPTLDATPAVVVLAVAQREAFGQVVGVGRIEAAPHEHQHASRERLDLGVIPSAGMTGVGLLGRQQRVAGLRNTRNKRRVVLRGRATGRLRSCCAACCAI